MQNTCAVVDLPAMRHEATHSGCGTAACDGPRSRCRPQSIVVLRRTTSAQCLACAEPYHCAVVCVHVPVGWCSRCGHQRVVNYASPVGLGVYLDAHSKWKQAATKTAVVVRSPDAATDACFVTTDVDVFLDADTDSEGGRGVATMHCVSVHSQTQNAKELAGRGHALGAVCKRLRQRWAEEDAP